MEIIKGPSAASARFSKWLAVGMVVVTTGLGVANSCVSLPVGLVYIAIAAALVGLVRYSVGREQACVQGEFWLRQFNEANAEFHCAVKSGNLEAMRAAHDATVMAYSRWLREIGL
jgi:hypothetical protein